MASNHHRSPPKRRSRPRYIAPSNPPSDGDGQPKSPQTSLPTIKNDRPVRIGNRIIDSPDRRPRRTCLVRIHSVMFCCINFSGLGACVSRAALSGKRSKGHDLYQKTTAVDRRTLDALNIEPKSIERLHEVFVQIDRDGSGEISLSEFFRFFSHKRRFPKCSGNLFGANEHRLRPAKKRL